MPVIETELEPIQRLTKDLKAAALLLSKQEVRFLVDSYYARQEERKRSANQLRQLLESKEPSTVLQWLVTQSESLENQIRRALDAWSASQTAGQWARSITGIGPVISAGLLAYIDIERAPTAGHIWRFAGLDPTTKWSKGEKRPWNASLKTLCWKIGESFVKVSGRDDDVYGKVWLKRKEYEQRRSDAGECADEAARRAQTVGKSTEAYKHYSQGRLPPGHIHARAKRYAVKLFLSHFHHVLYTVHYHAAPPRPWVIEHGGHGDYFPPPNLDIIGG